MARSHRSSPEALKPEQQLAALVVNRLQLTPPVNLREVARGRTRIEFDTIPGECDGLVVGLHSPKPLIIIDRHQPEARARFTLAHELGHVLIPWHLGSNVLCHPEHSVFEDSPTFEARYYAATSEAQANRFAGELLVPSAWLRRCIALCGVERILPLVSMVQSMAEVSPHVACLRLATELPAGYVFALVEALRGHVALSGQSPGTSIDPPVRRERLRRERLDQWAEAVEEAQHGTRWLIWWRFRSESSAGPVDADPRTARQVLDALLSRHGGNRAAAIQHLLSGVIGAANSEAGRRGETSGDALYATFRGRFAVVRDLPDAMLNDADFDLWLRKRANDLARP